MAEGHANRTVHLVEAMRRRIAGRALMPGDRLPSVRAFAKTMAVSPSTVVEAYDRLVAEGLIRAVRGAGFFVRDQVSQPLTLMAAETPPQRAVDPFWVSRQSLDADETTLKPGCGWLPPDWLPHEAISRALRHLARSDAALLCDYGSTRGLQALRRLLLARFEEERLSLGSEQILLTSSGTQALDLVCRFLLRPGDTVLIDDPCYFNFQALLKAHQSAVIGVRYTENGPDMTEFEAILRERQPKLYLTNSALHNPTGATLSPHTAHRMISLAAEHRMTIVEDDIFADLEPEPSVRLAVLDGLTHVIRIGSFSKTLSASLRCGYIAARPDWIEGLIDLQVATQFGGPSPLTAGVIAEVLGSGSYRKHLEALRRRLAHQRSEVADRLKALGITPVLMPRGGFYLWCRLPASCSSTALAQTALAEGLVLAPGNVFSIGQSADQLMRFNTAQMSDRRIDLILARALQAQSGA